MALSLPANFKNDLGRDTNLFPIVVIGSFPYLWSVGNWDQWIKNSIVLSTNSFSFTETVDTITPQSTTVNTLPLLLNVPSLKESIDIEKTRKYKISNLTLSISNANYNSKRFHDIVEEKPESFVTKSLINTECRIFWWSPSTTWIEPIDITGETSPETSALQVYYGIIRKYETGLDTVKLFIEDRSQTKFHKDLPLDENYLKGENVLEKYQNKPIPFCYGKIDKAPTIVDTRSGTPVIKADSGPIQGADSLYLDTDDVILRVWENILQTFGYHNELEGEDWTHNQWTIVDNNFILTDTLLLNNNIIQTRYVGPPKHIAVKVHNNTGDYNLTNTPLSEDVPNALTSEDMHDINIGVFNKEFNVTTTHTGSNNLLTEPDPPYMLGTHYLELANGLGLSTDAVAVLSASINGVRLPNYWNAYDSNGFDREMWEDMHSTGNITLYEGQDTYGNPLEIGLGEVTQTNYHRLSELLDQNGSVVDRAYKLFYLPEFSDYDTDGNYSSDAVFGNDGAAMHIYRYDQPANATNQLDTRHMPKAVLQIVGGTYKIWTGAGQTFIGTTNVNISDVTSKNIYKFTSFEIDTVQDIKSPLSKNFYINVTGGREYSGGGRIRTAPHIITHIIGNQLYEPGTFPEESYPDEADAYGTDYNWLYDFSVNKKINSKKLFEGLASASPFIPRFSNTGVFKFDVIKESYENLEDDEYIEINGDDVIDISYSRTSENSIFTKIELKYKWNYAREEFDKSYSNPGYTNKTGIAIEDIGLDGYSRDYYGLEGDIDSTLIVDGEPGKYIRTYETASLLSKWLLLWHCNSHLILSARLSIKYINIEVGDLVTFDTLFMKPYGINYKDGDVVNGQVVYKYFMVFSTNRTLQGYVDIKCMQMHDLKGCVEGYDCAFVCGGTAEEDQCGVCGGVCVGESDTPCPDTTGNYVLNCEQMCAEGQQVDCAGVCGGDAVVDECGVCGGTGIPDGDCDCDGNELDACGVCGGSGPTSVCCDGSPVCDNTTDCDEVVCTEYPTYLIGFNVMPVGWNTDDFMAQMEEIGFNDNIVMLTEGNLVDNKYSVADWRFAFRIDDAGYSNLADMNYVDKITFTITPGINLEGVDSSEYIEIIAEDNGVEYEAVQYDDAGNINIYLGDTVDLSQVFYLAGNQSFAEHDVYPLFKIKDEHLGGEGILPSEFKAAVDVNVKWNGKYDNDYGDVTFHLHYEYANCGAALGDLNGDGIWNVLDIVNIANCVLANNCADHQYTCASDINDDGLWNVLDIVNLVNCVLANNCGD